MMKRGKVQGSQTQTSPAPLKGWQQIATFLGEPVSVVQRWASEGMPLTRQGRFVTTTAEQLNAWLGRESGKPVHVVTEDTDLSAELKRGLAFVRQEGKPSLHKPDALSPKRSKRKPRPRVGRGIYQSNIHCARIPDGNRQCGIGRR